MRKTSENTGEFSPFSLFTFSDGIYQRATCAPAGCCAAGCLDAHTSISMRSPFEPTEWGALQGSDWDVTEKSDLALS